MNPNSVKQDVIDAFDPTRSANLSIYEIEQESGLTKEDIKAILKEEYEYCVSEISEAVDHAQWGDVLSYARFCEKFDTEFDVRQMQRNGEFALQS